MYRNSLLLCVLLVLPLSARADDAPADIQPLVQGHTEFALDLFARLRTEDGNLFYSPYSISSALAMTSAGARGTTADQMAQVLRHRLPPSRLHPACAELTRSLNGYGLPRDYQLNIANSLWGDEQLMFHGSFQKLILANYGTRVQSLRFSNPDPARKTINHWVERRTHGKIPELLQARDIDETTRLVLVNSLYFQSAWETPFVTNRTEPQAPFQLAGGKTVHVALMQRVGTFKCLEADGFQALELPYEGGQLSMVVLLPQDKTNLDKLEQGLTAANLARCLGEMKSRDVEVGLPRFKIKSRLNLGDTLQEMGMRLAFDPSQADFSGLTSQERLSISKVVHEAFVEVDETGTEATAATAVVLSRGDPLATMTFRADHPFLFLLRDTQTGCILFVGRVSNPSL